MLKDEIISAINILIEDREYEVEELELLSENFQFLTPDDQEEVLSKTIKHAKNYLKSTSVFNKDNKKNPSAEDFTVSEILYELMDEVQSYIIEDETVYDIYDILRLILIEVMPEEISYMESLEGPNLIARIEKLKLTWAHLLVEEEQKRTKKIAFQDKLNYQSGIISISSFENKLTRMNAYQTYLSTCSELLDIEFERLGLQTELRNGSNRKPKSKIEEELAKTLQEQQWQTAEVEIQYANYQDTISPKEQSRTTRQTALLKQLNIELSQHKN